MVCSAFATSGGIATMNRNFALEFVRVTEAAALESARLMGRGDEKQPILRGEA